jgi:hypothetical protein
MGKRKSSKQEILKAVEKTGDQKPTVPDWLNAIGNLLLGLAAIGTLVFMIIQAAK